MDSMVYKDISENKDFIFGKLSKVEIQADKDVSGKKGHVTSLKKNWGHFQS